MVMFLGALACAVLIAASVGMSTHGGFVYALDDPYIHLALARQIHSGHYGIQPLEWSAPSSSLLWPLLLAPLSGPVMEYLPLVLNILACLLTLWVLADVIRDAPAPAWARILSVMFIASGLNLFGLTLMGMEHGLQVALTAWLARGLLNGRHGTTFWLCLTVLPWLRYECLAITLPTAVWLVWTGRLRGRATGAVFLSLTGLLAFAAFLHTHSGSVLPSSVLAKSAETSTDTNLRTQPAFFAVLALLGWLMRTEAVRWMLCFAAPVFGFLLVGRVGQARYEPFMLVWLAVPLLAMVAHLRLPASTAPDASTQSKDVTTGLMALGLGILLSFPALTKGNLQSLASSRAVSEQHVTMARIAVALGEDVAVNDIGLVAWRSPHAVLDLWGLGSSDALNARLRGNKPSDVWIDELMSRRGVRYALIYQDWFPALPKHWIKVGTLRLKHSRGLLGGGEVSLFAVDVQSAEKLRAVLLELRRDPKVSDMLRAQP